MFLSRIIIFSFLLFLVISCAVSENEQLTIKGTSTLETVYTDTITVNSSIVSLAPIKTSNVTYLLFGTYKDPDFGLISAKGFTQLSYNSSSISEDAVYDSAVMHLSFGYSYGDFTKPQSLYVYRLTESILNTDHYNNDLTYYDPTPLNEQVYFLPTPLDNPQVNLKLKDALGLDFFQKIKSNATDFSSQENFNAYFRGLVFTSGPDNTVIFGIDRKSANSYISIFYHIDESLVANAVSLPITNGNVQYNQIQYAYPNSNFSTLGPGDEIKTSTFNNKGFAASGSGLVTKLTFPYLDKFADVTGKIAINKAELIVENTLIYNQFSPPPPAFYFFETNESNKLLFYTNPDLTANPNQDSVIEAVQYNSPLNTLDHSQSNILSMAYNKDLNNYTATITYYIEALINKKKPNGGIFLYPSGMGSTVNNLVFGDPSFPGNKNLKLKIYYSILNPTKTL